MDTNSRPQFFGLLAGLFLAAGLVLSATVFTHAWLKIREPMTVSVKGSARKTVRSDLIIWRGTFSVEAEKLLDAQRTLKADLEKAEAFFKSKGVSDYKLSPIEIKELTSKAKEGETPKTTGYRLSQSLEVESREVDKITQFARDSTGLVEQGVRFVSETPKYIYTKAGEAKVEMLADATKDARARAEQIAKQGGREINQLRSAAMGVFQITPLYSTETSWEGANDTTSLEKTITAVVTAEFSMK